MLEAAERADVILSSGGVSVGEEDHVRSVLQSLGRLTLWKIAVKPGKPLAFGEAAGTPFMGLPGNPASVLVTALVFARPFLFACQGISEPAPEPFALPACFDHPASDRQQYLRARRGAEGVECYPNQSSGVLLSACWGDGLVVQAPGEAIASRQPVRFLPYALLR